MEQIKQRYRSPETSAVFVKAQVVPCGRPYGENTGKFTLGDNHNNKKLKLI